MSERGHLNLSGVSVRFVRPGTGYFHALRDIDLDAAPGEYITIIGSNGAGKSTLLNVIAGVVRPWKGSVQLDGRSIASFSEAQLSRKMSRVHQDPQLGVCGDLSISENMMLGLLKGRRKSIFRSALRPGRVTEAKEILARYGRGLEDRLDVLAEGFSGGQRQLTALAMATANQPELLLLDEHTSALDPEIGRVVMERTDELIRETGTTTLMITHNMRYAAQYGDRLLMMSNGRIVKDVSAEEKAALGEEGLIEVFREVAAEEVTDRMLG